MLPTSMSATARLADGVLSGCRLSLSRAITLVESHNRLHPASAASLLTRVTASSPPSPTFRLGISGAPGAGKSTLIERLGLHVATASFPVAVLAVDPSSPLSRGSILGDKTRMSLLSQHAHAYVRPTASRGVLGGIARRTDEAVALCEAAGFRLVFVETVGVGQSEAAVADAVDALMLIVGPAGGDEVQAAKRGVLEFTDGVVVGKADGGMEGRARETAGMFKEAVAIKGGRRGRGTPQVVMHSVEDRRKKGAGGGEEEEVLFTEGLWEVVRGVHKRLEADGVINRERAMQRERWMWGEIRAELEARLLADEGVKPAMADVPRQMGEGQLMPRAAAQKLVNKFLRPQR